MKNLKLFFKNVGYLFRYNLKPLRALNHPSLLKSGSLEEVLDIYKYEIVDYINSIKTPKIKSIDETLDELHAKKASICRFGDGELDVMNGKNILFQNSSPELSARLKEVLSSSSANCFIAIPKVIYSGKDNITELAKYFWRMNGGRLRRELEKYINFSDQYYSAEISIACSIYKNYDAEGYFNKFRKLWDGRDITIICGKTVFGKIDNKIFDSARTVEYMDAPTENAFNSYNAILAEAKKIDQGRLVVIILGPTATVLAYDLSQAGYQALDLGHIAKSYDWYKKNSSTDKLDDAIDFFDKD